MEINTQPLDSLLNLQAPQARLSRKENVPAENFEKLLAQQIQGTDSPDAVANGDALQAAMLSQIKLDNTDKIGQSTELAALQAAFDEASGALDLWDQYARTLGSSSSNTSLRDAYGMLEGLDSRIASLKENPVIGENSDLGGLINELAILSTTEKFKFNRGDYLG